MWIRLDQAAIEARNSAITRLERWLLERYASVKKRSPVFHRDSRDYDYVRWLYYEGLLTDREPHEIEESVCVVFGFMLEDRYGLQWVFRRCDGNALQFGVRLGDDDTIFPLSPAYVRAFPVPNPAAAGEVLSLDDHMFEVYETLERGKDCLLRVVEEISRGRTESGR